MTIGTYQRHAELGGRIADVMVAMAIDAERVVDVDSLAVVPMVRPLGKVRCGLFVATHARFQMGAELGSNKTKLPLMGTRVIFRVATMAVVAGEAVGIVHAQGKSMDGVGKLAAGV